MEKIGHLDIDWKALNLRINNLDNIECNPGPLPSLKQDQEELGFTDKNYNVDNCRHNEYTSDTLADLLPENFLSQHGMTSNMIIKILEHRPGTFTSPHYDYYGIAKRVYNADDETEYKRLWIPCMDYKFGHVLCIGDDTIIANYKAGDVYEFPKAIIHSASNMGIHTRRVMTITGGQLKN
mgnify:FL=1